MQLVAVIGRRLLGRFVFRFPARPRECGPAETVSGTAKVLDGDTIVVAGERIRLHGIDAPELDQTFVWRGREIACGIMSLAALEALIAGVTVRCEVIERDCYGRLVAKVFSSNGVDIGRRLVAAGWAIAYRRYSSDYVEAETEARRAKRGMWRGTFEAPWVWRASSVAMERRIGADPPAPPRHRPRLGI